MSDLKLNLSFFIQENKRLVNAFLAFVCGVITLIFYFQSSSQSLEVSSKEAFEKWQQSEDELSYIELRKTLRKTPSLEKKYAPLIASTLSLRNQTQEALVLAKESLREVKNEAPYHAAFSEVSFLIEEGQFQEALERSVTLKQQLEKLEGIGEMVGEQFSTGTVLYAQNLIRIASLQKHLHNRPGERAAWDEFESYLKTRGSLYAFINEAFKESGSNLSEYVSFRKSLLQR